MSLQIEESVREDILILTLNGQLTFGDAESIREKILSLAAAGHLKVVVDLSHVFEVFNEVQDAVNSFFPQRENRRFDFLSFIRSRTSAGR